jgi:hypothetical protein
MKRYMDILMNGRKYERMNDFMDGQTDEWMGRHGSTEGQTHMERIEDVHGFCATLIEILLG